jgi:antiviral helicase SKI2
MHILTTL